MVIGHCVELCANVLTLQLQKNDAFHDFDVHDDHLSDGDDDSSGSYAVALSTPIKKSTVTDTGDQLNIKDDHFGENSKVPNTYFDFCSTLSKSADNTLFDNLYKSGSGRAKKTNKLNSDLTDLLSKSEIIDSKSTITDNTHSINVDLRELEVPMNRQPSDAIYFTDSQQMIEDLLLYWNHSDPVLRTNTQLLIGNFISNVLRHAASIEEYMAANGVQCGSRFLNINVLFSILLKVNEMVWEKYNRIHDHRNIMYCFAIFRA